MSPVGESSTTELVSDGFSIVVAVIMESFGELVMKVVVVSTLGGLVSSKVSLVVGMLLVGRVSGAVERLTRAVIVGKAILGTVVILSSVVSIVESVWEGSNGLVTL